MVRKEHENRRSLAAPPAGSIRRFGKRPSRPPRLTLANVLAVSQAARTVVLLGDPQQLEQPMQGSHPEGTDVSALHHLLNDHQTIAADRGLFLEETWRLHPAICCFTSELFYEGRLQPLSGLEVQDLIADCRVTGTGLRYLPVPHEGNQNASPEEGDCIRDLVAESWQPPQSGSTAVSRIVLSLDAHAETASITQP